MKRILLAACSSLLVLAISSGIYAQNQTPQPAAETAGFPADYPTNQGGILIRDSSWKTMANAMPSKTKVAHGIAASLSYGAVPTKIVAEYAGEHAATQVALDQPAFCICHILSLPGQPVIVRLHEKKNARELDAGRMYVRPIIGNSKMGDANKSDLIAIEQSHPDPQVWLIRPQTPLEPGEYALMLGTQNFNIYPFTVNAPVASSTSAK